MTLALTSGCGGSAPPASAPDETAATSAPEYKPSGATLQGDDAAKGDAAAEKPAAASATKSDVPAPEFKENGSVLEAINAVPQGTPRLNIDQEDLGQPLGKVEIYEPCKPGSAHFKAKVAVWDGKAVGLDLTTTPKNPKLAACIADKIRGITWSAKVKSLNIVEYTF